MTKQKEEAEIRNKDQIYDMIDRIQRAPEEEWPQEKIVLHYEKLVYSLANKYAYDRMLIEDLYQVGMIGLMNATKRFDKSYGTTFETFAIPTIIGEIKRYLRDKTWSVYVPRRVKDLGPKIQKAIDHLTVELEKSPSVQDIAAYLSLPEEELSEVMSMGNNYNSLSVDFKYNKSSDEKLFTLLDIIGVDESYFDQVEMKMLLESIFPSLDKREQSVLHYLFYERLTQREVGDILGVSQMQVSRLQKKALDKLRAELETMDDLET